jgi:hypothetical protein
MQSGLGVRTRLRLSIGLLGAIVIVSAVVLTYALKTVSSALNTAKAADVAIQHVLELNQLTSEIEFNWENRPSCRMIPRKPRCRIACATTAPTSLLCLRAGPITARPAERRRSSRTFRG